MLGITVRLAGWAADTFAVAASVAILIVAVRGVRVWVDRKER
jgi:hypothetical protein